MGLADRSYRIIVEFRAWIEVAVGERLPFSSPEHHDREDAWSLTTKWQSEPHIWYEIALRPFLPQLRVGILTDDPDRSGDFEQMIAAADFTLQEFVAHGLKAAGLAWPDPPVEHYCERGCSFYFATPLDLKSIDVLADHSFREEAFRVLLGYHGAFSGSAGG